LFVGILMNPFAVPIDVDTTRKGRFYPLAVVLLMLGSVLFAAVPAASEDRAAGDWTMASDGLPTSGTYFGVAFGDVNEDGKLDLVGAADGSGLRVFLGDGTGSWTAVSSHPATSGGYGDVVLDDYDDDGHLDILAGSPGNGAGNPRGLHLWKGDGKGGFSDVTSGSGLPTNGHWRGVDFGDVNGDGDTDIAACSGYGSSEGIHVYLGDGSGKFEDASTGLPGSQDRDSNVVLADFNGDGNLDLAAGGAAGVDVYLVTKGPRGNLVWTQSSTGLPDSRMSGISTADWNKDGSVDLVISAYNAGGGNGVYAYKNSGNGGRWTSSSSGLPDDGDYIENAVGDLDGDGNADILTAGSYGGEYGIHVYYGDGSGSWAESSPGFTTNVQYVGVDIGDYDGDATLDIAAGKRTRGGGLEVWKNPSSQVPPPQPVVEVNFPSGGESLTGGSLHDVEWAISSGTPGFEVTLRYSTDGGSTFNQVIAEEVTQSETGTGTTTWGVPVLNSENVRVRAEVVDAASQAVVRSGLDFEIDSTPPEVSSHFPTDGASDVSTSTMVIVTFSEGMAAASAGAVSISGPGNPELSDPSWSGTQLTLATHGLQAEEEYTVTVGTDAVDDSLPGNAKEVATSFTFTTGNGVAPTPPIVQHTSPVHDETGVAVGTSVTIGFSKAMDITATRNAITVSPELDWSPVWSEGNTVVALDPVGRMSPNTRYTVTVSDTAMASDGTGMDVPYTFRFTTGDPPDLTPPSVADNYPPDRQREISPYLEEVTITFSEPMDTSSVESVISVSPGTITSKTWRVGDTVLVLGLDMTDGQKYTVTVGGSATDKAGNPLGEDFSFFFVTKEFEDPADDAPGMVASLVMLALLVMVVVTRLRRRG
jgi:hypothetical protein